LSNNNKKETIAILGAGSGGIYTLVDLGRLGIKPRLCDTNAALLTDLKARGGIELEGANVDFAPVEFVTADVREAINGATIIIVCTGGNAQEAAARDMAPHLVDGQLLLLIQGNTGGALVVRRALDAAGCKAAVDIAEMDNYPTSAWRRSPFRISPIVTKNWLQIAAFPATRTAAVFARLSPLYPTAVAAPSTVATSFQNMNAMLHVANCIANAANIDHGGNFKFYGEGVTPLVANLLRAVNSERVAVAAAFGVKALSLEDWFERAYRVRGSSIVDTCQKLTSNSDGPYQPTPSPKNFDHKYVGEDVPTGLIPMSAIGKAVGVPTPAIDAVIEIVKQMTGKDYAANGRSLERLGLAGKSAAEVRHVFEHGFS
jgi:opine dehydrogenase